MLLCMYMLGRGGGGAWVNGESSVYCYIGIAKVNEDICWCLCEIYNISTH